MKNNLNKLEKEVKMEFESVQIPFDVCPKCGKKITSKNGSESEVKHNLKVHLMSCKGLPSQVENAKA
jgi:hypothetical protein